MMAWKQLMKNIGVGKMKNYKLDIKEMTEQFNEIQSAIEATHGDLSGDHLATHEMSEMVQKHAFKLGLVGDYRAKLNGLNCGFIFIYENDKSIKFSLSTADFEYSKNKKIGLEFFSIKPEQKMVTVRMSEDDYYLFQLHEKWELVE